MDMRWIRGLVYLLHVTLIDALGGGLLSHHTPLCGAATPNLMVPVASGGHLVYRSNPRPHTLGFVGPGFESHAPATCRACPEPRDPQTPMYGV